MANKNDSENGNIILVAPKVRTVLLFIYRTIADLPNLIKFVGRTPLINEDMSLNFRKVNVKPGDVIERNSFGDIVKVYDAKELEQNFELRGTYNFASEHHNKVVEKPKRERKEKEKKS